MEVGGKALSDEKKELYAHKKNEIYKSYINKMTPEEILPGVNDFLRKAKEKKIKIALGSASKNAKSILSKVKLLNSFDAIVDGTNVQKAKPNPQVFQLGAQLLQASPQSCIVFEDAAAGITAAHRANMRCVGIGNSDVLSAADMVIPGFSGVGLDDLKF